jgi:uracil permease
LFGYVLCLAVELIGWADFNIIGTWKELNSFFNMPDFAFLHWNFKDFEVSMLLDILLLFAPVSICALLEHYSDHKVLSNIIGQDLTEEPGLHRSLMGDGIASMIGTWVCGLPNTSYGESTATIGFSRVASVIVSTVAALFLGSLAFIEPVQVFLRSIPSCVFGGCAMILYGYIACSGLKTLINHKADLEDTRNLIVTSVILTVGVSGIFLFSQSFKGVSLAMILGVVLNLILGIKKKA